MDQEAAKRVTLAEVMRSDSRRLQSIYDGPSRSIYNDSSATRGLTDRRLDDASHVTR